MTSIEHPWLQECVTSTAYLPSGATDGIVAAAICSKGATRRSGLIVKATYMRPQRCHPYCCSKRPVQLRKNRDIFGTTLQYCRANCAGAKTRNVANIDLILSSVARIIFEEMARYVQSDSYLAKGFFGSHPGRTLIPDLTLIWRDQVFRRTHC